MNNSIAILRLDLERAHDCLSVEDGKGDNLLPLSQEWVHLQRDQERLY
jgi:hypothetical protein